jgi:hypothetical protein
LGAQPAVDVPASRRLDGDWIVIAAMVIGLATAAAMRQDYNGAGIRHVHAALTAVTPPIGETRWLLFPTVAWTVLHPLSAAGRIAGIESAARVLVAISVAAALIYLVALRAWLEAIGCDVSRRAATLLLAAATAPFALSYADVTEPQIPAALVVAALAIAARRRAAGTETPGVVLFVVSVVAAAALVYEGLLVALALVPLVAHAPLRRASTFAGAIAIVAFAVIVAIATRITVGDSSNVAAQSIVQGEANPRVRRFISTPTPAKWATAMVAGPALAFVALPRFSGLPALASSFRDPASRGSAMANALRLVVGAAYVAALVWAVVRRRDWRLAIAIAGILALPVLRNNQYGYLKFFVLWPVVVSLAAVAFAPRPVALAGVVLLALNGELLVAAIANGRAGRTMFSSAYAGASANACFVTSGYAPPFEYLWPGRSVSILGTLSLGSDPATQARVLTNTLINCYCDASEVWTDTADESAPLVSFLASSFDYHSVDLTALLPDPQERVTKSPGPPPLFVYTRQRAAAACRVIRSATR